MRDADKCVTHVLMEVLFDSTQVDEYNYSLFFYRGDVALYALYYSLYHTHECVCVLCICGYKIMGV